MSSKPFVAFLDGRALAWKPSPPFLEGDDFLVDYLEARLGLAGETIAVTPTGPFVSASLDEPLAVLAALSALGGDLVVSEDAPQLDSPPEGAVA